MTWETHGAFRTDKKMWQIDHTIPLQYKQDGVEPTMEDIIE